MFMNDLLKSIRILLLCLILSTKPVIKDIDL